MRHALWIFDHFDTGMAFVCGILVAVLVFLLFLKQLEIK